MEIDIQLLPFPPKPLFLSNRTIVVIDVLRATSVIVHALANGAEEVIPVSTVEEAFKRAKLYSRGSTLLGGERGSRKVNGFDLGNSPKEYTAETVKGKRVILTTTNGTKAFDMVRAGAKILVASFFNIEAAAEKSLATGRDLLIFPSGDEGRFSLEDTVCGGMLLDRISKKGGSEVVLTDASHAAAILYKGFETRLSEALHLSKHGRDLFDLGFGDDLSFCSQTDITDLVPEFREGVIKASW